MKYCADFSPLIVTIKLRRASNYYLYLSRMIEITLKYKGKSYTQRTSANATIIEFTEELLKSHRSREEGEGLKDIEIATVKFIGFSKFAIDLSNEEHGRMKISELQVKEKKSYMMLASNLESVRKLRNDENVDLRIR